MLYFPERTGRRKSINNDFEVRLCERERSCLKRSVSRWAKEQRIKKHSFNGKLTCILQSVYKRMLVWQRYILTERAGVGRKSDRARSEISTAINIQVADFLFVTPCFDVVGYQYFGRSFCLYLHPENKLWLTNYSGIFVILNVQLL